MVFAVGTVFGLRYAPYGPLYRWLVRPRLGPPRELEPEAPPRFAQGVGLVFGRGGAGPWPAGPPPHASYIWLGRRAPSPSARNAGG
ncbi:MAG TPA: DUF4395 domain-containing protein [Streptosporangiaceae bacterium]|nr:DUF4395 domain-containing protein [Streptosporangiaceae bacterium]